MKKKSFPVTNIGSVSLMMIFIVLCLVTFSTLSLSSATSDYHFSEKIASHNTNYYEATNQASLRLEEIDQVLKDVYARNPADYLTAATNALSDSQLCEMTLSGDIVIASYEIPVTDKQALAVTLTLQPLENLSKGYYRVTSWQEVGSSDWQGDSNLNLIK